MKTKLNPDSFNVVANIYSEYVNEYVHHWFGGTFSDYDKAYDFWNNWWPDKKEITKVMTMRRVDGDYSHHELEIGLYDAYGNNLKLYTETVDYDNENENVMAPKYAYDAFVRLFPELKDKITQYKTTKDPHTIEIIFTTREFRWPILFTYYGVLDWSMTPKSRKD